MKNVRTTVDEFSARNYRRRGAAAWLLLATSLVFSLFAVLAARGENFSSTSGANFINDSGAAQRQIAGEWVADFSRKNPEEIQFTITRLSSREGRHTSSSGVALSELQGLTREQAFSRRADVNFRIVREAGTFQCEGFFTQGKGAGVWTLTINQNFVSAMRGRGYDNLSEEELFTAAITNVTTKSADDLKAAGYDQLSFKELVEANIFKVTGEFIREMQSAGFENLRFRELVEARIFRVDSHYAREVEEMGFGRQPLKKLVEMRIHKITPEFINLMRSMGFDNLSIRELTELSVHHVTPEFVNGIKAEGFPSISQRQAVELKIHGVDGPFIRRVRAKGFADVTLKQLVELRIHGIIN